MKTKWNQSGRPEYFPFRRPPGSTLLHSLILFSLLIALPACLFPSCRRQELPDLVDQQIIEVRVDSTWFRLGLSIENRISDSLARKERLDIFLYNADGLRELECWQRFDGIPDSISIKAAERPMIAVAIANSPRSFNRKGIERYDSIELLTYEFDEDSPEAPIMSGICNLLPGKAGSIALRPLLSKVVLAEISNTMRGYLRLEDPRIYLENMNASAEILRSDGFRPSEMREGYISARLPFDIGLFKQNPGTFLYCYPNDSPEPTIGTPETVLVLECEIRGTTCRFPVKIPELRRNSTVNVNLIVNGPEDYESKVY